MRICRMWFSPCESDYLKHKVEISLLRTIKIFPSNVQIHPWEIYLCSILRKSLSSLFHLWLLLIASDHHLVCASVSAFHQKDCSGTVHSGDIKWKQQSNASLRTVLSESNGFFRSTSEGGFFTWFNPKSSSSESFRSHISNPSWTWCALEALRLRGRKSERSRVKKLLVKRFFS